MRTTLDIDDDVLEAAWAIGRQTHRTAGAVLSDLARRALTMSPPCGEAGQRARGVGGVVPFESRGGTVTNELIDRLRERCLLSALRLSQSAVGGRGCAADR